MTDILFNTLPGEKGQIGEIVLNRPKALNALTLEMCVDLQNQLKKWENDSAIKAVVIRGEGDRAFCAGGDIRAIYQNGLDQAEKSHAFFKAEYAMNKTIFHYKKPYIALMHGITMGGGVGISVHGSFRVASKNFLLAMPETGIGFFPDIGAGYFLTRCPYYIGRYLGLTGTAIHRDDALALGLVTHCIDDTAWPDLIKLLCETDLPSCDAVARLLMQHVTSLGGSAVLIEQKKLIETCFSANTVEEIMARLKQSNDPFAHKTLETLQKKSPLSLKVTLEQLKRAASLSYDEVNAMEYKIACQFAKTPDFHEGVRAAVIDKDQRPVWQPASLSDVSPEMISAYF